MPTSSSFSLVSVRRFRRWATATLVAVYLLIGVGGVVRSTGSGMGCPDWPRCFGSWVPPTAVNQLPTDYREVYAGKRKAKNEKLAKYLIKLGMPELAHRIVNEPAIYQEAVFNATKTWIEYLNRVLGALIGLFVVGMFLFAWPLRKQQPILWWLSGLAVLLTGLQGWIGSVVVSTNLLPGIVTGHMLLALALVGLLLYVRLRANAPIKVAFKYQRLAVRLLLLALVLTLVQVSFGTAVREGIDRAAQTLGEANRESWVASTGTVFLRHRSFSWLVLLTGLLGAYLAGRFARNKKIRNLALAVIGVLLLNVITGVALGYAGFPAALQPLHLLLGTLLVGVEFALTLHLLPTRRGEAVEGQKIGTKEMALQ